MPIKLFLLFILASCAQTPKQQDPVCFQMTEKGSDKETTWCIKDNQRDKIKYGNNKPKPKRYHRGKIR